MNISEQTLENWARGPSETEALKCENAETAIRKAITTDDQLSKLDIKVFLQGSYRARTNVRLDSDVDVCVRYDETFFTDYPAGTTDASFGNIDGTMAFATFKDMVGDALINYFGTDAVARGDKAFNVHANTYRIDADVVPTFEHRRYQLNSDGTHYYLSGVEFKTDSGKRIINWPDQTYDNGVNRNSSSSRRYKRVIRILKRLRNKMQEVGIDEAENIGSFLIECLVWNAPLEAFMHDTFTENLCHVLADLWNRTRHEVDCSEWGEVNELKYLFCTGQPWTREQANNFLDATWNFMGYK